MSQIACRLTP
uniref:Uncharacterized protein n=1 Tax=Anguilla anguilla TaxID=7936 RepID=A0A0E9RBU8_ANGAN